MGANLFAARVFLSKKQAEARHATKMPPRASLCACLARGGFKIFFDDCFDVSLVIKQESVVTVFSVIIRSLLFYCKK